MLKIRVIPCLLLRNWGIEKSVRFKDHVYIGSPINAVRVFNGRGVDELVLLDIIATKENRAPEPAIIEQIAEEASMPLTVGGGIRSVADVTLLLKAGADRVVINTAAYERPELITETADVFGRQCIVVSIDARRRKGGGHEVCIRGGSQPIGLDPAQWARKAELLGAGEIFLTSIDQDGTMEGYDIDLIRTVSSAVSIPVIACGGAGSAQDFADAVDVGGASAVAAGAFFLFYGRKRTVLITYPTDEELMRCLGEDRIRRKEPIPMPIEVHRPPEGP